MAAAFGGADRRSSHCRCSSCSWPAMQPPPPGELAAGQVAAAIVSGPLYVWAKVEQDGLVVDEYTAGTLVVESPDGRRGILGLDRHAGPDGEPLAVLYEQSTADERGPHTMSLRTVPVEARPLVDPRPWTEVDPVEPAPFALSDADPVVASLAALPAGEPVPAIVSLLAQPDFNPTVEAELRRWTERLTDEETWEVRWALTQEYKRETHALQEEMIDWLTERGARVRERFWAGSALLVEAPPELLVALTRHPEVRTVSLVGEIVPEVDYIDGDAVRVGQQIKQYWDYGFDGERANPTRHPYGDITLAIIDKYFEDDVLAFKEDAGPLTRVASMWDCSVSPCQMKADFGVPPGDHGTKMAAIAAGDLTDGQDPGISAPNRPKGSWITPEARLVLIEVRSSLEDAFYRAMDKAAELLVDGLNFSNQTSLEPDPCAGTGDYSSKVNDVFRNGGVFFTKSAGNSGHADPNACTVTAPGGAATSFTVGATLDSYFGTSNDVRTGPIRTSSSRGGYPYLGGSRTILATVAPGALYFVPNHFGGYLECGGTSCSAPQLLGAFANLRDWWLSTGTPAAFVNHPPNSYVTLLLMTDRRSESGGFRTNGFDELWGGGRFRARLFTDAGMDAPWGRATGSTAVNDGQIVSVPINGGNALPATADRLSVAVWWMEPNQGAGGAGGADITIAIVTTCGAYAAQADVSYDTKKRIFRSGGVGGRCWKLELNCFDAPPSAWEQGASRRTVYFAWYWEDEARDDADGPPADIQ